LLCPFFEFNHQGPQRTQGRVGVQMPEPATLQGLQGQGPLRRWKLGDPVLQFGGEEVTGNFRAKTRDGNPKGGEATIGIGGAAVDRADDAIEDGG
jgi:hypothetical protein